MMSSASAPDASYEHQTFPIDDIVIIPSFFSHTSDLEKAFGNLPLHSDIKGLIDTIINQIPEEDIRKPYDDLSCLIENTTHHALAVSEFLAKASAVKEELASRNNVIRELLLNITPVEHPSEVVTWVRSELSAFTSRRFTHAREIIEHALGSSSYLSGLYGLLGPDDLFFYEIANLLEDFCRSEKLSDKFPSHYFVSEIQFLRETFTSFLGSADNHYATLADWLPPPGSSQDFVREMAEFEAKWAGILGSPEALSRLIRNIQESDVVKSLQLDLMDPTDPAGFELALIKPYGIGRTLDHGLAGKLSSNAISVSSTLKIYPNFEPISQKASLNMALRTSIAREALRLKNTFLRDFTPNGLEALLAHLKEANNSGNTKHSEPPIVPISFLSVNQWNLLTNHFHP